MGDDDSTMVAASSDFLARPALLDAEHPFIGDWHMDRISGLVDAEPVTIKRMRIDQRLLHVELKVSDARLHSISAELNGDTVELRDEAAACSVQALLACSVQALLEGDGIVWELEYQTPTRTARTRRVMHSSKQGAQLIAERVDLNTEGSPTALRTEYWARAGQR